MHCQHTAYYRAVDATFVDPASTLASLAGIPSSRSAAGYRPDDRGRVDSGAEWPTVTAGQVDACRKPVGLDRCPHHAGVDAVQHQLGSTEHLEPSTGVEFAPRQIDKPVTAPALHDRTTKIEIPVVVNDIDVDIPANLCAVGPGKIDGFTS